MPPTCGSPRFLSRHGAPRRGPPLYHPRTNLVPTRDILYFMFGFRLKAKSEHEATQVRRWYGAGGKVTYSYQDTGKRRIAPWQSPTLPFLAFLPLEPPTVDYVARHHNQQYQQPAHGNVPNGEAAQKWLVEPANMEL